MSQTLAIIPAKRHSEGVPGKNLTPIHPDGRHCTQMALDLGAVTCDATVLTSDFSDAIRWGSHWGLERPAALCQPDTPMIDVVRHALACVPGPDDEIVVLLQPTSPLRTAATVQQAIQMLRDDPHATSVVSVAPSYPREWTLCVARITGSQPSLHILHESEDGWSCSDLSDMPARRQDCGESWKRDGVVYAFRRSTVAGRDIYGRYALPLYTPPEESLSIDTPADWDEAVRRLSTRTALGV